MARETLFFFFCRWTSCQCDELVHALPSDLAFASFRRALSGVNPWAQLLQPLWALQQWGAASLGIAGTLNLLVVRHFNIMLTGMRQYPLAWVAQRLVTGIKKEKFASGVTRSFSSPILFSLTANENFCFLPLLLYPACLKSIWIVFCHPWVDRSILTILRFSTVIELIQNKQCQGGKKVFITVKQDFKQFSAEHLSWRGTEQWLWESILLWLHSQ